MQINSLKQELLGQLLYIKTYIHIHALHNCFTFVFNI